MAAAKWFLRRNGEKWLAYEQSEILIGILIKINRGSRAKAEIKRNEKIPKINLIW